MMSTLADELTKGGGRWETAPAEVDLAEAQWWEQYSDVEDRYCWVQTPAIQRFLRGRYLRQIVGSLPLNGRLLEFGCGTGWLSLLLAEYGASEVWGIDFSPAQIKRAEEEARRRGLDRVRFRCLAGGLDGLAAELPERGFDALIVHGVLHHLTNSEIREVISGFCDRLGKPDAKVFIVEPVLYEKSETQEAFARWEALSSQLMLLPLRGEKLGVRRVTDEERKVLNEIARRDVGIPPRGPSPKEMPFRPGEIEALLEPWIELSETTPILLFSFIASRNLLLLQLSHPVVGRLVAWPYLWLVRALERWMLAHFPTPPGYTVFELMVGITRAVN